MRLLRSPRLCRPVLIQTVAAVAVLMSPAAATAADVPGPLVPAPAPWQVTTLTDPTDPAGPVPAAVSVTRPVRSVSRSGHRRALARTGVWQPARTCQPVVTADGWPLRSGDTFDLISACTHIPVAELLAANPDASPTALRVGQLVSLPGTRR